MAQNKETSAVVDALLIGIAGGAIVGTMFLAPNAVQILDKPLAMFSRKLDQRQKERGLSRLRRYLKAQGLVRGDYRHGIELTKKAEQRIRKRKIRDLKIDRPAAWDARWRLVLFDIPETKRDARAAFIGLLRSLGFQLLQQSVWVYPYACKEEVYLAAHFYQVDEWVTYIKTDHLDNDRDLQLRFSGILK